TELSTTARGAAASLHSCSFYLGQAVGPVVYGVSFAQVGPQPSLLVGALVVLTVGLVCSRLLRHPVRDCRCARVTYPGLVQTRQNPHHWGRRPGVPRKRG